MRLIEGVGVNDAGYSVTRFELVDGKLKRVWICPYYQTWHSCITRSYSEKYHARRPSYAGCSVAREWLTFSKFREWMMSQDWNGKALDKDILQPGNKIYSDYYCVFVSRELNNFILDQPSRRGDYPLGVSLHKRTNTLRADCMNPFTKRQESLGHFSCVDSAHEAWLARKHYHACAYAEMQDDPRAAHALRTRYIKERM